MRLSMTLGETGLEVPRSQGYGWGSHWVTVGRGGQPEPQFSLPCSTILGSRLRKQPEHVLAPR